jgi:hypothetical protein
MRMTDLLQVLLVSHDARTGDGMVDPDRRLAQQDIEPHPRTSGLRPAGRLTASLGALRRRLDAGALTPRRSGSEIAALIGA